jgi:hypothetical protein
MAREAAAASGRWSSAQPGAFQRAYPLPHPSRATATGSAAVLLSLKPPS